MRLLILSNRSAEAWRRAIISITGATSVVEAGGGVGRPPLDDVDVVATDGTGDTHGDLERIESFVLAGGALLVMTSDHADAGWRKITGVDVGEALSPGEYFATLHDGPAGARLDGEVPFVGSFSPLSSRAATVLASVSVGFQPRDLVTHARRGSGSVTVCGAGAEAIAATPLAVLLRRAVAPPRTTTTAGALGVGIVGYGPFGGMGYYHGLAITDTEGLELVAVVDPSDDRRKAAEQAFPGVAAYASAEELAGDDDVDVVIVATPPSAHFVLSRRLLRAGKHVACEKPLCFTAAEADDLISTAATVDRVLTVHQNRRWDPDFVAVRRAVDAGALGDLFNVETFVGGFEHPCRAWHSDVQVSGGAVYDWGSHHVDWILQLLGDAPARVTTFGHKRVWHDVTNLDQLRLHLSWEDGREAEFFQSDVVAVRRPKFFVQGTAGTLVGHYRPLLFERLEPGRGYVGDRPHHAEAPAELTLARYESGYGLTETRLPPAPEQRFGFHRNLADHLHLGEPLAVTAASARAVVAVLEASQRSSAEGGRVVELAH